MQDVVAKLDVAAFAVDDALRVVAWNELAEGGGRVPKAEALGRPCYEVLPAIDIESGRPCQETCPLLPESARQGWAHNRALRAPWKGGGWVRLQCFAVKASLPNTESRNICLLEPPEDHALERQARVLDLVEALYPALAADTAPAQAIAASLEALKRIAGSDSAELHVPGPDGGFEPAIHVGSTLRPPISRISEAAASGLPGVPGGPPHLVIAEYPHDEDRGGPTGWTLCAPIVAQGRLVGLVAISSDLAAFDVAAAARVMFPLSVHLAGYVAKLNLERSERLKRSEGLDRSERSEGSEHSDRSEGSGRSDSAEPSGRSEVRGSARGSVRSGRETAPLAPRLVVRCLGPFLLTVDGQIVPGSRFKRQKALQALAYLVAQRGRSVSRGALAEMLWPGADPRQSGRNLRVVLHDLRRAIEPDPAKGVLSAFVRSEGDLVVLDPSRNVWVDAEAFVVAARQAAGFGNQGNDDEALAACREAMSLYQGDFLEGDAYADWAIICREQFRELVLGVIKQAALLLDRRGLRDEAIEFCRRALEVDRGREEFHRDLMRLLTASGRRDEAARQYQACRRVLRRDLGTVPSPETEALYRALQEASLA